MISQEQRIAALEEEVRTLKAIVRELIRTAPVKI